MDEELSGPTVLLTGLPRSGTTLTCELLNQVPDTVALDEPLDYWSFTGQDPPRRTTTVAQRLASAFGLAVRGAGPSTRAVDHARICANIERFCIDSRHSITSRGVATSRHVDGKVLGSKVADHYTETGLRARLAEWGDISIDKELSPRFMLAVKHTSAFTALLETLLERFPVYAVVRNPLSVLSSWQTVPFPPQQGHVQMGEALDGELARDLAGIDDRLERQLHLLRWFFGRFHRLLDATAVIRYEDIVATGGAALGVISEQASTLRVTLENRNKDRTVYDTETARTVGARLLESDGPWLHFYPRESIAELLPG